MTTPVLRRSGRAKIGLLVAVFSAGAFASLGVHYVLASGIPTSTPLYYSGTLAESGQLVDGVRSITVTLFADGNTTGNSICTTTASVTVSAGRFRLPLADQCKTAINQNPNAQVLVMAGASTFGPRPIGAVPYAIEADHATSATNAAPGGGIASALDGLQSAAHPPSAVQASLSEQAAYNLPFSDEALGPTQLPFDVVNVDSSRDADAGAEFDPSTGLFTPRRSGVYLLQCTASFVWNSKALPTGPDGEVAVQIQKNNGGTPSELLSNEVAASGIVNRPQAVGIAELDAGDQIGCWAAQYNTDVLVTTVYAAIGRTSFSAARLY